MVSCRKEPQRIRNIFSQRLISFINKTQHRLLVLVVTLCTVSELVGEILLGELWGNILALVLPNCCICKLIVVTESLTLLGLDRKSVV